MQTSFWPLEVTPFAPAQFCWQLGRRIRWAVVAFYYDRLMIGFENYRYMFGNMTIHERGIRMRSYEIVWGSWSWWRCWMGIFCACRCFAVGIDIDLWTMSRFSPIWSLDWRMCLIGEFGVASIHWFIDNIISRHHWITIFDPSIPMIPSGHFPWNLLICIPKISSPWFHAPKTSTFRWFFWGVPCLPCLMTPLDLTSFGC